MQGLNLEIWIRSESQRRVAAQEVMGVTGEARKKLTKPKQRPSTKKKGKKPGADSPFIGSPAKAAKEVVEVIEPRAEDIMAFVNLGPKRVVTNLVAANKARYVSPLDMPESLSFGHSTLKDFSDGEMLTLLSLTHASYCLDILSRWLHSPLTKVFPSIVFLALLAFLVNVSDGEMLTLYLSTASSILS